jgi:hypothetical protein
VASRCALLALALAASLLFVACGGERRTHADTVRSIEKSLPPITPVGPGLGEADPPPGLAEGWKTDFSKRAVSLDEIKSGGPGRDGIPAIDEPRFVGVDEAHFLEDREPVIELDVDGDVRAYPLQILIWHEIVNDVVGGTPVAVTFCPLCNTALVFDRRVRGRTLDFGTTGNLRNSDLVMYDRQTESWWQQFGGDAIAGSYTGAELDLLPAHIVGWGEFARRHPDGKVLSRNTGSERAYGRNPYPGYDDVDSPPIFSTPNARDRRLPAKERVVFIERGDDTIAVPFSVLAKRKLIRVEAGGEQLDVRWLPGVRSALDDGEIASSRTVGSAEVLAAGSPVAFDQPFWFAVAAFRPDTRIVR